MGFVLYKIPFDARMLALALFQTVSQRECSPNMLALSPVALVAVVIEGMKPCPSHASLSLASL